MYFSGGVPPDGKTAAKQSAGLFCPRTAYT